MSLSSRTVTGPAILCTTLTASLTKAAPFAYMRFAAAAALFAAVPCLAQNTSVPRDATAEVQSAHSEFNAALVEADVTALDRLIADTYVFTDPTGRVSSKQDILKGLSHQAIRIKAQDVRNVTVHVYGNAAVETGVLTSTANRDGKDTSGTFRYTRVWVHQDGRWQTVAFQETKPQ